jgi:tRNA pseudouridine32 synthase/23S rRNA pseudouridine746 synthase
VSLVVLHHDPFLAVINKPAGLLSCPGRDPADRDSVQARVPLVFPCATGPFLVHRLDQPTSGVMVVALDPGTHRSLSLQFQERRTEKAYVAVLVGDVAGTEGTIRLRFRLDVENRPHQIHDPAQGKMGVTHWRVVGRSPGRTRVELHPETGRTHQLRVHAAHPLGLGCPVAGDQLYGDPSTADRLLLHAWQLAFDHPETGERLSFQAPVPF